jgi:hypothetical protein
VSVLSLEEEQSVRDWRERYATTLGFNSTQATLIAYDNTIDLHQLESLIRRGCDPTIALLIVK